MKKRTISSQDIAKQKVIDLFHRAYTTCPAYKDFIDTKELNPADVVSPKDFHKIPIMDKENYLHRYSLEEKLIDNKLLSDFYMITASSGSTGEPTFWPRDFGIDEMLEKKKEELYEQHYQISSKKTLIIITFALGMWTAGMLTAKLTWPCARNHKLSVISTGMNRENILHALKAFHSHYEQIVIIGYPPFLINLLQYCDHQGFELPKEKINILYTAETLSLRAREFLTDQISTTGSFKKVVGFYASSEAGIIATETPSLAMLAERGKNSNGFNLQLYGNPNPATLFEFNPLNKYLENHKGEILITSDQPVPLIRYNIHDRGGIYTKAELKKLCARFSIDTKDIELPEWSVFIHGRSNSVVMTANIYIEDIRYCLDHSQFSSKLSGYFRFGVVETDDLKKQLQVRVYLRHGDSLNDEEKETFTKDFYDTLFTVNSDLSALKGNHEYLSSIAPINIEFFPEEEYDSSGIKLRYFL